jgi:hypothetical protein
MTNMQQQQEALQEEAEEDQEQQQQPPQQQQHQQQGDPRLLEGLPAPALRRVLRLASTPANPAMCRLCCVSKGVRDAVEAVPLPDIHVAVWYKFSVRGVNKAARVAGDAGLMAWLCRYAPYLQGLSVVQQVSEGWREPGPMDHLLGALDSRVVQRLGGLGPLVRALQARGAARLFALGQQLLLGLAGDDAQHNVQPAAAPLKRLRLVNVDVSPSLCRCLVSFDQLQVLILTGCTAWEPSFRCTEPWQHQGGQQQLLRALAGFRRLQKLHLELDEYWHVNNADLLRALPSSLTAADLKVGTQTEEDEPLASNSDLAHLVRLTSLHVRRFEITLPLPLGQQELPRQQEQQGRQPLGPPALKVLSLWPVRANAWYAAPMLEAVELSFNIYGAARLAQLAACPYLRQLSVQYYRAHGERFGNASGVSALTQLTRLRLEVLGYGEAENRRAAASALAHEVAALGQLQLLEVDHGGLMSMQPQTWLSQLHSLTRLVSLMVEGHTSGRDPTVFSTLTDMLARCYSSSSSSSSSGRSIAGSGGSSTSGTSAAVSSAAMAPAMIRSSSSSCCSQQVGHAPGALRPIVQLTLCSRKYRALVIPPDAESIERLQAEVAAMAVLLPHLQLVCAPDTYTCPCWSAEEEAQCFVEPTGQENRPAVVQPAATV